MKNSLALEILNLDWLSKTMGAHLSMENLILEIENFLRTRISARKSLVLLWDPDKKSFRPNYPRGVKLKLKIKKSVLLDALEANEPVFTSRKILIPLKAQDKYIGVVVLDSFTFSGLPIKYKEEVVFLSKIAGMVLNNAHFFIESDRINKDLFRFNVLSRALNPHLDEGAVAKILAEGIGGIIKFDVISLVILGRKAPLLYLRSKTALSRQDIRLVKNKLGELIASLTRSPLSLTKFTEKIDIPRIRNTKAGISSFLSAPLVTKDKILGAICLGSFKKNAFTGHDQQGISLLASQGAIAMENIILYADLQRTYFSIVKALTSAIEAKDPYTQGHSVLVSCYAEAIAREMELSASMIESIKIAGLLHDLGKIGIPEEILLKMGKLTFGEYEVIKSHPDIAINILKSVEFPHFAKEAKNLEVIPELTLNLFEPADLSAEVKLMIFHHHEKYSGGGYPKGIKGEEIPLGARILSVADTFEALTASRPYRKAFSVEEARGILIKASGDQLDPKIVKVFLNILKKKSLEELKSQVSL